MKRVLISYVIIITCTHAAIAACSETRTYESCKPGYYLDSATCKTCPTSGGIAGKSADKNTKGIGACYIPSGNSFSDDTGSGTYAGDCYYWDPTGGSIEIGSGGTVINP